MMSIPDREAVHERIYWRGILTQTMCIDLGGGVLNAFKECDTLTVNLGGVQLLDFSSLVLLCALKRQTNEVGKALLLEGLENPVVAAVVHRYRSNGRRLCRVYCGQSCLFESASVVARPV